MFSRSLGVSSFCGKKCYDFPNIQSYPVKGGNYVFFQKDENPGSCHFQARAPGVRFSFTTVALQSCDFRAGAPGVRFLYYGRTFKLRFFEPKLREYVSFTIRSYYKVAIFNPELREYASCTTVVLQSCDFQAGAPGVRFLFLRSY